MPKETFHSAKSPSGTLLEISGRLTPTASAISCWVWQANHRPKIRTFRNLAAFDAHREGPLVSVYGAECMTPATAAAVAHAVMEATRVAGGRAADPCGRLAADLQGAIDQYPDGKIPSTHLRLILTRYRSRCADPRPAAAAHPEREGR